MHVVSDPDALFEFLCERLFIEKYPRIVIPAVETVLHLLNTRDDAVYIVVAT